MWGRQFVRSTSGWAPFLRRFSTVVGRRIEVVEEYGVASVVSDVKFSPPAAHEVRIKVEAASINPLDPLMVNGYGRSMFPGFDAQGNEFPVLLGRDAFGVVESVGSEVWNIGKGDRVVTAVSPVPLRSGCLADYVNVPASAVVSAPENLDSALAASFPFTATTAWSALYRFGGVERGQRVLVLGGGGSVGESR